MLQNPVCILPIFQPPYQKTCGQTVRKTLRFVFYAVFTLLVRLIFVCFSTVRPPSPFDGTQPSFPQRLVDPEWRARNVAEQQQRRQHQPDHVERRHPIYTLQRFRLPVQQHEPAVATGMSVAWNSIALNKQHETWTLVTKSGWRNVVALVTAYELNFVECCQVPNGVDSSIFHNAKRFKINLEISFISKIAMLLQQNRNVILVFRCVTRFSSSKKTRFRVDCQS